MSTAVSSPRQSYSPFNLLSRELLKRGYTITELPLSKKYIEITAPNGWKWVTRWAALSYPFVSVAAKQISINKTLAYEFATFHGVSIPKTLYLPEDEPKLDDFLAKYAPVIVKPADGSGSHGLTLNIMEPAKLAEALAFAREFSSRVIVQQQFTGHEVRITIAEGEAVSVILRQPARLIGDGVSTISELIVQENKARESLQFEQIPYPMLSGAIIPAYFMADQTVPGKDKVVELSKNSLTSGGASLHEISSIIHPSYVETALKLSKGLNPEFLVIDLMIADYTVPQTDDNYIFMEFNTAPALRLYFGMRTGKVYDMTAKIVDMLDTRSRKK